MRFTKLTALIVINLRALYIRLCEHEKEIEKTRYISSFTRQQKKLIMSDIFKSAAAEHAAKENHILDFDGVQVIEYVSDWHLRGIKEAIHIRSNKNNMNREGGERYELSAIWNTLLSRKTEQRKGTGGRGRAGGSTL